MRRDGLWHPRLLGLLAAAGHGDTVVIADAGLPIPRGVETVDLVWRSGEPGFMPVLEAIVAECPFERATVASELSDRALRDRAAAVLGDALIDEVPHEQLKALTHDAIVAVRTGSVIPYTNVVLRCGVSGHFHHTAP
jgi:D-ribose pyranase